MLATCLVVKRHCSGMSKTVVERSVVMAAEWEWDHDGDGRNWETRQTEQAAARESVRLSVREGG